jgi:lysophospholipase L1-like esterase
MQLEKDKTLLFIGDSITDCGRSRPIGEGNGLGSGYVHLIHALLESKYPELNLRTLNMGVNGNRVSNLQERWDEDVVIQEPDYISILIGINDVWRQFDNPSALMQVTIDIYERSLVKLVEQAVARSERVFLMSPFYLEENTEEPMRKKMDEYGRVVEKIAGEYNLMFIDIQKNFDSYLEKRATQTLSPDRVHPNVTGHMIIAKAFLDKIDFEW